ncbi:hypothetical protein TESG_06992 [Trichophyton tonsurans CBS 112818]|uniref:Uncharacterized protein n=1 Tax=Trichophyton tonsurans (strain CBS 112818) TaxID=647933 RepID=F2S7V1_TRIT1|nr:hypothetical protein TESG_06992 [Trichophyton tonsurans CBS 112818]
MTRFGATTCSPHVFALPDPSTKHGWADIIAGRGWRSQEARGNKQGVLEGVEAEQDGMWGGGPADIWEARRTLRTSTYSPYRWFWFDKSFECVEQVGSERCCFVDDVTSRTIRSALHRRLRILSVCLFERQ